jgi:peptide/nickel transport system permease protein
VGATLARFMIRRALAGVLFVVVVSSSAVLLARLAPGDVTAQMRVSGFTAAQIAAERDRLGLDRPVLAHLGDWLRGLVRFDLGRTSKGQAVAPLVGDAAAHTARLAAVALIAATLIGIPLGIVTGARPRGWIARGFTPISIALLACPPLVGALGLLLLAVETGWLSVTPGSIALPAIALALPLAASLERLQSQATSDALSSLDLTAAAARGIPWRRRLWIHAGRQSLRPVLGVYGVMIGTLFSGSLAVEVITGWPGLGQLMAAALTSREIFLVAGGVSAGAALIVAGNIAADGVRLFVDPRVRELR